MNAKDIRQKLIFTLFGMLIALSLLLLTGAATIENKSQIGRYRLTAVARSNFHDLFVIDTTTGAVKWIGNDEGKPFEQIKGR